VHNLEHGYTVVWYRADAPSEQTQNLERIAKTFGSDDYNPADKFIAAPWSEADGAGFPGREERRDHTLTADPNDPGDVTKQRAFGKRVPMSAVQGSRNSWPNTRRPTRRSRTARNTGTPSALTRSCRRAGW
jgi:hypothetical protein